MPEIQAKGAGGLGGFGSLAGLAGINIDNLGNQDAIRPDLYPNILQSIPFALYLLRQPVYSPKLSKRLSLDVYMGEIGQNWYSGLLSESKNSAEKTTDIIKSQPQFIEITEEQNELIKGVQSNINATYDKKTGILVISAIEQEAFVAATVAKKSLDYLTNYITTYRTEKARQQVSFLRQQVAEANKRYQSTEYALSSYRDNNRAVYLNTARIEEQRLQADYLLAQSVYNELSKQLEQARIKVQEETPVFKTLEPAAVPLQKSGPKRTIIMLGFVITAILLMVLVQLIRTYPFKTAVN